jgi:hypothetical protein
MITTLFGRHSTAVKVMEGVGVVLVPFALTRCAMVREGTSHYALIAAILVIYAFIRLCATARWYRDVPRCSGIELQFRKALVPTGYAMTICLSLYLVFGWLGFLVLCAFLLVVVAHVDCILLYFHHRDRDPTPVNFYSSGKFLTPPNA